MNRWPVTTILLGCLLADLFFPTRLIASTDDLDTFNREYPAAAARLDDRFSQATGTALIRSISPLRPNDRDVEEVRFAFDHGIEKVNVSRFQEVPGSKRLLLGNVVYCMGPDFIFRLARRAGTQAYLVTSKDNSQAERSKYLSRYGRLLNAHHAVLGMPMSRVLKAPGFQVISAESRVVDGRPLMEVIYEVGNQQPSKTKVTLLLDPENDWVIRSWDYHGAAGNDFVYRCTITFGQSLEGFLLPMGVELETVRDGSVQRADFSDWSFASTPLESFGMPHYSLPDLVTPQTSNPGLKPWLVAIIVLLAFMAILIAWRAGRRFGAASS